MYFVIAREFCRISLFSGRRASDKTGEDYRNLTDTKLNTEMTHVSHMKVDDIIPFFYLYFSNAYPIYCKAVVRSGVINIYTSLLTLDTPN